MSEDTAQQDFTQASEITMQTYRQIAAVYAQHHQLSSLPPFWQENMQRFLSALQTHPSWQADSSLPILDAGCGPGRDALIFASQGLTVHAIDLSPDMLAQARQLCLNQPGSERITFQHMDMRHLDFPDQSHAGAWVSASFLHIPKQENLAVLRELMRVLMPGGTLALLVKEVDGKADERYDLHVASGTPRFFARYRGGELWDLLERAGLRVLSLVSRPSEIGDSWLAALAQKSNETTHTAWRG